MAEPNGYRQASLPATDPQSPDGAALAAIAEGRIRVEVESGEIYTPDGRRAECPDRRTAYGRVFVGGPAQRSAMAHRVVWLAAHGFIPDGLEVNHRNRMRWDNRLANLELVTPGGNQAHWRGEPYSSIESGYDLSEIMRRVELAPEEDPVRPPIYSNFLSGTRGLSGERRWRRPPPPRRSDPRIIE